MQRTSLGIELEESDSQFTYSNSSSPQVSLRVRLAYRD